MFNLLTKLAWRCAAFVILISTVQARTIYVAPDGNDKSSGTQVEPLATPIGAAELLRKNRDVKTIEFAAGRYPGGMFLRQLEGVAYKETPPLTIRAAEGAEVIFDGSNRITTGDKLATGVYRIPGSTLAMWEADTRKRYERVADIRTVMTTPATFTVDSDGIAFHTSDSQPPNRHQLGAARDNFGIRSYRANVRIEGISFHNYLAGTWAAGVLVSAPNLVITKCKTWNARAGFFFYGAKDGTRDCRLESSSAEDVGCGVYCMGEDVDTIDCRFVKTHDDFMVHGYWQDDTGIMYYYPSRRGTVRGNLIKGFANGIYIKCAKSFYLVEHNTIIEANAGLYRSPDYRRESSYVRNIITDVSSPFLKGDLITVTEVDHNLVWAPKDKQLFMKTLEGATRAGYRGNVMANPRFADPANGDYRLLPSSPCAKLAGDKRPWGAFPLVPEGFVDQQPPSVSLKLASPAKRAGDVGTLITEMDPWLGGKRTLVKDLFEAQDGLDYLVPSTELSLEVIADDAAGRATHMRLRFNDMPWPEPSAFKRFLKVTLPDGDGPHRLEVRVADDAGNWSGPTGLMISRQSEAPTVVGKPHVHANDHGVVISFTTDRPGFAHVQYGADHAHQATQPQYVHRDWRVMDGADWISAWSKTRTVHHIPILAPAVTHGETVPYRIVTRDIMGNRLVQAQGEFKVQGPPRTIVVATDGNDTDSRGGADAPMRSIQFAMDRALPGDTVLVKPGVYTGEIYVSHGGIPNAPIKLLSQERFGAVLDGVRKVKGILRLEAASHLVVDGFDIRWFDRLGCGVYVADSSHVTVKRCKVWNMEWSQDWGSGVGIFLHRSPNAKLTENLLLRCEQGAVMLQSPRTQAHHNTALRNTYGAIGWSIQSGPGSSMVGNSFCYNGNDQVYFETLDRSELDTFTSDHNNFGTVLGKKYVKPGRQTLEPMKQSVYGGGSKAMLRIDGTRYHTMADWRKDTGWDGNSIFAHPDYVDVHNHDFRVAANSPNLQQHEGRKIIGAFGPKAE